MTKDSWITQTPPSDQSDQITNNYLPRNEIIPSKRKFLAPLINLYKKIMIRLLYPPLANLIKVQNEFNGETVRTLNDLREALATTLKNTDENLKAIQEGSNTEKKMLELNHDRYMENKEVEKKMLELNHDRYMENRQIENLFHTELLNLKKDHADIVFASAHLQNHTDYFQQNLELIQQKLDELEREIHSALEAQMRFQSELPRIESKFVQPQTIDEVKRSLRDDINDQKLRVNQAFESISTLRKMFITGSLSMRSHPSKMLKLSFENVPSFEVLPENGPITESGQDQIFFELAEKFRGSEEEIALRQKIYLDYLEGKTPIIDVGCGRGEMLEQLSRKGWEAIGVENNGLMVGYCLSKGLKAINEDALHYLEGLGPDTAGSIFASHFVEHLDLNSLLRFLMLAMSRLKDNGNLIIETPNPAGLCVFSQSFYLDPSHIRPIHGDAMQLLLESVGFKIKKVLYLSPWPEETKLGPISLNGEMPEAFAGVIEKLNHLLFAPRDYSIIATK